MIGASQHVGSRALRGFVERHQPPLLLSGHIHESPRVSSSYRDTLGRTVIVNPGQFGASRLCDPNAPVDECGPAKHCAPSDRWPGYHACAS